MKSTSLDDLTPIEVYPELDEGPNSATGPRACPVRIVEQLQAAIKEMKSQKTESEEK